MIVVVLVIIIFANDLCMDIIYFSFKYLLVFAQFPILEHKSPKFISQNNATKIVEIIKHPVGLFLLSLTIYTHYQRRSASSSSGSSGGKGPRWKDGKAVGGNIKGVSDLPKPPKG